MFWNGVAALGVIDPIGGVVFGDDLIVSERQLYTTVMVNKRLFLWVTVIMVNLTPVVYGKGLMSNVLSSVMSICNWPCGVKDTVEEGDIIVPSKMESCKQCYSLRSRQPWRLRILTNAPPTFFFIKSTPKNVIDVTGNHLARQHILAGCCFR